MMDNKVSLHIRKFNDKVRLMNQTQSRELVLSPTEARNLHSEIFELLTQIAELAVQQENAAKNEVIQVGMDGGGFK